MFSKPNKPSKSGSAVRTEGAEPPARKPIACSLIAENVSLEGDLASDGDVQLDGAVRGDLRVAHLTIGETGQVEGAINAESAEIRGRVVGTITAKTIRLYPTARIEGDLTHDRLAIDAGAEFTGRSVKLVQPVLEQLSLIAEAAE